VLSTEVLKQMGLGGAAPPLALSAMGADVHRARQRCGGGSACVDGTNGVGWCRRRWWDSGSHWSLCWGCVVDRGPPLVRAGGRQCGGGRGCVAWCGHW
jgi:hypothetical protein